MGVARGGLGLGVGPRILPTVGRLSPAITASEANRAV